MFALRFKLAIFALAGQTMAIPLGVPLDLVTPGASVARVAACGFKSVQASFDEPLQEEVLDVSDVTSAAEQQLRCVALASLGSPIYVVFPPSVDQAYQSLYWRLSREQGKADARTWLAKRGLLARLPIYDPKSSNDAAFARTLETLCGRNAADTLCAKRGMATFEACAPTFGSLTTKPCGVWSMPRRRRATHSVSPAMKHIGQTARPAFQAHGPSRNFSLSYSQKAMR